MSVISRIYISNDIFRIGDRIYTNGYVRESGNFLFFIQKSCVNNFSQFPLPEPTAIFKIKKK